MIPKPLPAILDANVLYPLHLRNTLLGAAHKELFRPHWSARILDETTRNLIQQRLMEDHQAQTLTQRMRDIFPEALVEDYEHLIPSMPNDPKDRHVAAAAVHIGAELIITDNLRDFRRLPNGVDAKSPDAFLVDLLNVRPDALIAVLRAQARGYRKPPMTTARLLRSLGRVVPRFAQQAERLL